MRRLMSSNCDTLFKKNNQQTFEKVKRERKRGGIKEMNKGGEGGDSHWDWVSDEQLFPTRNKGTLLASLIVFILRTNNPLQKGKEEF